MQRIEKKAKKHTKPVHVDKKKKEVFVYDEHPQFEDTISVGGKKRRIVYVPTLPGRTSYEEACRVKDNGDLEINTQYPLFKSKRYGDLFKRIYIIANLARRECSRVEDIYKFILSHIEKEFKNF